MYVFSVPVEPESHLLPVRISKGSQYQFEDEDPAIYSDLEEPHRNFHYEAYPNEQKNFPEQEQRIGYQQFEFNLGGGASGTSGGGVSKSFKRLQVW